MFLSSRVASVNFSAAFISLAAVAVTGTSATAQEYNWNGFSVYAGIGAGKLDADVTVHDETTYTTEKTCSPHMPKPQPKPPMYKPGMKKIPSYKKKCKPSNAPWTDTARHVISEMSDSSRFSFLGTVGVGADYEFTPGIVIGAFADFDISDASMDFSGSSRKLKRNKKKKPKLFSRTSIAGELEQDYSFSIGGRLGLLTPNRQGMIYILAAYTQVHMDSSTATINNFGRTFGKHGDTFGNSVVVNMPSTFSGLTLGVGGELKLTNAWSLKAEGRYTNLGSKSIGYSGTSESSKLLSLHGCGDYLKVQGPCTAKHLVKTTTSKGTVDIDPEIYSARIVLSYRFN